MSRGLLLVWREPSYKRAGVMPGLFWLRQGDEDCGSGAAAERGMVR